MISARPLLVGLLLLGTGCNQPLPQKEHTFSRLPEDAELALRRDPPAAPATERLNARLRQSELAQHLDLTIAESGTSAPIAGMGFFPGRSDGYLVYRNGTSFHLAEDGSVTPLDVLTPRIDRVLAGGGAARTLIGVNPGGPLGAWNTANLSQQLILRAGKTTFAQSQLFDAEITGSGTLAVAAEEQRLEVWSLRSGDLIRSVTVKGAQPRVIAAASASDAIYFGSDDGRVALWGKGGIATLYSHTGPVLDITLIPGRGVIASAAKDGTVKVFDIRHGRLLGQMTFPKAAREVHVSPGGRFVLAIPAEGRAQVFDLDTMTLATLGGFPNLHVARVVLPDSGAAIVLGDQGLLSRWNLGRATAGKGFGPPDGAELVDFAVARPQGFVLTADEANRVTPIRLADTVAGTAVAQSETPIRRIAVSDDGRWIMVALADGRIARFRFDPSQGEPLEIE